MSELQGIKVIELPDADTEIYKIVFREAIVNTVREQSKNFTLSPTIISEILEDVAEMYDKDKEIR